MTTYKVSLAVSKKIQTAKDLNDFYAFMERFGDDPSYCFPTTEQDRIDKLVEDISYTKGTYDLVNVKRIVGGAWKYEMSKRKVRQKALDYQMEQSAQSMSYGELAHYSDYFTRLGKRYGLIKEFKENGVL